MYNPSQRRLIVRELSRNNWKISATLDALHRDYEGFRTLSESTLRKMIKNGTFVLMEQYHEETVGQVRGETDLRMERVYQRAEALRNNPVRKWLVDTVKELRELVKTKSDAKLYKVLLECLELLKSIDIPEDHILPELVPIDERHCKPYVPGCAQYESWRRQPVVDSAELQDQPEPQPDGEESGATSPLEGVQDQPVPQPASGNAGAAGPAEVAAAGQDPA